MDLGRCIDDFEGLWTGILHAYLSFNIIPIELVDEENRVGEDDIDAGRWDTVNWFFGETADIFLFWREAVFDLVYYYSWALFDSKSMMF